MTGEGISTKGCVRCAKPGRRRDATDFALSRLAPDTPVEPSVDSRLCDPPDDLPGDPPDDLPGDLPGTSAVLFFEC
jgi:hypothetical protein